MIDARRPRGEGPDMDQGMIDRISHVIDLYGRRRSAAEAAGKSEDQIAAYRRGRNEPQFTAVVRLAHGLGISLDWVATGQPPMMLAERAQGVAPPVTAVPMFGMAEPAQGWYRPERTDSELSLGEIVGPYGKAVRAPGPELAPFGITKGKICLFAPNAPVTEGKVVLVEMTDGRWTLREFRGTRDGWYLLRGYLADDQGGYETFTDEVKASQVAMIVGLRAIVEQD